MAFRYELIHHPKASEDYFEAREFFEEIDPGLAKLFEEDFRAALAGLASGRSATHLFDKGSSIRWIKIAPVHPQSFLRSDGEQQALCFGGG